MTATTLTRKEKNIIRNSPCGICGAIPIIEKGERCHPHRIVPRCEGGEYVVGNVVPRCYSCHDVEHGGDGTAPYIGHCQEAGRKGGPIGGRRTKELHPGLAQRSGRQGGLSSHRRHPNQAREMGKARWYGITPKQRKVLARRAGLLGGKRTQELHATKAYEWGRLGGSIGGKRSQALHPGRARQWGPRANHIRWHVRHNLYCSTCSYCIGIKL